MSNQLARISEECLIRAQEIRPLIESRLGMRLSGTRQLLDYLIGRGIDAELELQASRQAQGNSGQAE